MVKKLAILTLFIVGSVVLPFQPLPAFNLYSHTQPSIYPIRILLASQQKNLILQNDKECTLLLSNRYPVHQKEIHFSILKEENTYKSGFYTILLNNEHHSLEKALQFAQKTREQYFKLSENRFLLHETDKHSFRVEVGLFSNEKETNFVLSLLDPLLPGIQTIRYESSQNAVLMKLDDRVFLLSELTDSLAAFKGFTLHSDESFLRFGNIAYPDDLLVFLVNHSLSLVNQTALETYLRGVVGSEMPDSWSMEALKAQALASRTYAYSRCIAAQKKNSYFDISDDTSSQVYLGIRYLPNSFQAIKETENQIITYQSKPIESVFHSSSGGYTENNEFIWSGSAATYLRAVPSPGEEISPHFSWFKSLQKKDVQIRLNDFLSKKKLPAIPPSCEFDLRITEKGVSPRVRKISLEYDGEKVSISGSEFVTLFNLKSTWFSLEWVNPIPYGFEPPFLHYYANDKVFNSDPILYMIGRGWGHGVGMSQYGALVMAKKGLTYRDIISHFYQSTQIQTIPLIENKKEQVLFQQNQVYFEPCCIQIQPGEYKAVAIRINTQSNVFGVSMELQFEKETLEIQKEDIREGTFLKSDNQSTIFMISESGAGYKIGLSREGKVGGVSGEGDLLFFRLKGKHNGITRVTLYQFQAFDSRLEPVFFEIKPMEITINERDIFPPVTKLIQTPNQLTNQKRVYFQWTGEDDQTPVSELLYSYRLNQEPWSAFSYITNVSLTLLQDGPYLFTVQAKDKEGNIEISPPQFSFLLDTVPPLLVVQPLPSITALSEITIRGRTEKDVSLLMNGQQVEYSQDGAFAIIVPLDMGKNSFQLIAMDKALNISIQEISLIRQESRIIIITMNIGSQKAIVDDKIVNLDSAPFIKQNRTYVPLRFIAEAFGASVQWFPDQRKIEITLVHPVISKTIQLWTDQKTAYVNGTPYLLDAEPFIVPPGRTVVPIRFIAESMESKVEWFSMTQTIKITFPGTVVNEISVNSNVGGYRR